MDYWKINPKLPSLSRATRVGRNGQDVQSQYDFKKTTFVGGGGQQRDGVGEREGERRREIFYKQKLKRSDGEFLGQCALNKQPYLAIVRSPVAAQQHRQASTNCDHTLGTYCEPYSTAQGVNT